MVDEKDEMGVAGGEEEYHFTDEHPDYDMAATAAAEPANAAPPKNLASRFQDSRRILLGAFVFLLLLGVVYKMLVPSSPSAPGDIVQTDLKTAPSVSKTSTAPAQQRQVATVNEQASAPPVITEPVSPPPVVTTAPEAQSSVAQPQAAPQVPDQAMSTLSGRVTSVEQQNAAILNTLQTQYSQKLSDLELQASQVRQEVKDLKAQVTEIEQAFHQLSTLLQKQAASSNPDTSEARTVAKKPKTAKQVGYSVQAIIPGRAWLKSDSGDTVTVAEGDTLRGVGRVVRIDPYDGIVNLDTGQKIITLSYGMGADE